MRGWRRTLLLLSGLTAVACAGDGPVAPEPIPPVALPAPSLTGSLVNARGREWGLRGTYVRRETSDSWEIAVQGLPGTSTCAGIILVVLDVERALDGRETALAVRLGGRCFGTVANPFRLARLPD